MKQGGVDAAAMQIMQYIGDDETVHTSEEGEMIGVYQFIIFLHEHIF